ncbi:MAG: hypothetical protein RLZZ387_496 [Chloroflexota bacterium]|jgi:hypothetical protein
MTYQKRSAPAIELLLEPHIYAYRDLADAIAITARQVSALIASEQDPSRKPIDALASLSPGLRAGRPRTSLLTPACLLGWYVAKADDDGIIRLSGLEISSLLGVSVWLVYRLERVLRQLGAIERRRSTDGSRSYVKLSWRDSMFGSTSTPVASIDQAA